MGSPEQDSSGGIFFTRMDKHGTEIGICGWLCSRNEPTGADKEMQELGEGHMEHQFGPQQQLIFPRSHTVFETH